jgi:uncharacterized membrane-anchored protein YitT (DUF2179 family)
MKLVVTHYGLNVATTEFADSPVENPLLVCLIAGVISGVGSGLIFRAGGSGGGTGIIAMVLKQIFRPRGAHLFFAQ